MMEMAGASSPAIFVGNTKKIEKMQKNFADIKKCIIFASDLRNKAGRADSRRYKKVRK